MNNFYNFYMDWHSILYCLEKKWYSITSTIIVEWKVLRVSRYFDTMFIYGYALCYIRNLPVRRNFEQWFLVIIIWYCNFPGTIIRFSNENFTTQHRNQLCIIKNKVFLFQSAVFYIITRRKTMKEVYFDSVEWTERVWWCTQKNWFI